MFGKVGWLGWHVYKGHKWHMKGDISQNVNMRYEHAFPLQLEIWQREKGSEELSKVTIWSILRNYMTKNYKTTYLHLPSMYMSCGCLRVWLLMLLDHGVYKLSNSDLLLCSLCWWQVLNIYCCYYNKLICYKLLKWYCLQSLQHPTVQF